MTIKAPRESGGIFAVMSAPRRRLNISTALNVFMDIRLKLALPKRFAGVPTSDALCLYFVHLEEILVSHSLAQRIATTHTTFVIQFVGFFLVNSVLSYYRSDSLI